ncbi:hypothetical protein [Candidatus Lokiarchaeum ossiferum]
MDPSSFLNRTYHFKRVSNRYLQFIKYFLIISIPSILLSFHIFKVYPTVISGILSYLAISVIPGNLILQLIKKHAKFTRIQSFLILLFVSYILSGLMWLSLIWMDFSLRTIIFILLLLLCSIFSTYVEFSNQKKAESINDPNSKIELKVAELTGLLLIIGFFISIYIVLYPNIARSVSADISRHFGWSVILGKKPSEYRMPYLLANLYESAFIFISNSTYLKINTILIFSNLTLILSFYQFASVLFSKLDYRIPMFATWLFFSNNSGGIGFFFVIILKVLIPSISQTFLYGVTNAVTYFSINSLYGLWNVPSIMAFNMLLFLFSIILKSIKDETQNKQISKIQAFCNHLIVALLFVGIFLTHIAEGILFCGFLGILNIIPKLKTTKINHTIIISLGFLTPIYMIYSLISSSFFDYLIDNKVLLIILGLILFLVITEFVSRKWLRKYEDKIQNTLELPGWDEKFIKMLKIITTLYVVGMITAGMYAYWFNAYLLNSNSILPLFTYSFKLGFTGLFGLLGMLFLYKEGKMKAEMIIIFIFVLYAFLFGRFVSFINVFIFSTGYYENRFLLFIFLGLCLIAPYAIIDFLKDIQLKSSWKINKKTFISTLFLGMIITSNSLMAVFNIENETLDRFQSEYQLTDNELEAVDNLIKIGNTDVNSWVVTLERKSQRTVYSAGYANMYQYNDKLYNATTPDMDLRYLFKSTEVEHPYIFLSSNESISLANRSSSFLLDYINSQQILFQNAEIEIFNSTKPSFPLIRSENALILPSNEVGNFSDQYLGYLFLSLSFINYSAYLSSDSQIYDKKTIILPTDPLELEPNITNFGEMSRFMDFVNNGGDLIVLNTQEDGYFSDFLFSNENSTISSNIIENNQSISINLPTEISVPQKKLLTLENLTKIWNFKAGNNEISPYMIEKDLGLGTISYLNLVPFLQAFDKLNESFYEEYNFYEELFQMVNLTKMTNNDWNDQYIGMADQIIIDDPEIQTDVILFPQDMIFDEIIIQYNNKTSESFSNLSNLDLRSSNFTILGTEMNLSTGISYYIESFFTQIGINFQNALDSVISFENQNKTHLFTSIESIQINSDQSYCYIREPEINAKKMQFINWRNSFYETSSELRNRIYLGNIKTTLDLGDPFIIIRNIEVIQGEMEEIVFNENETNERNPFYDDIHALPFYLLSAIILGVIYFWYQKIENKRNNMDVRE